MTPVFKTGPGFFAAYTAKANKNVPKDKIRFYFADISAYEDPLAGDKQLDQTNFTILPGMAEGKPETAKAMLELYNVLKMNLETIKAEAAK